MSRSSRRAARIDPAPRQSWLDRSSSWLVPAVVIVATFLTFLPGLNGEFVTWDDDRNFLMNEAYRGLGPAQLRWMFTTFLLGPYQPLSWMSLGLDYTLWGMAPLGYHVTSLVIHVVNAWLVYALAIRLFRFAGFDGFGGFDRFGGFNKLAVRASAGAAALLFAVHPLRVESVSWVTERRDVLSGLFAILTLIAYVRMADLRRRGEAAGRWLAVAAGMFALSLLAKASAMALAAALVAMDIWLLRRHRPSTSNPNPLTIRLLLIEKIPFLVLGVAAAVVAAIGQQTMATLTAMDQHGPLQRVARGLYGLTFYLWKSIWPVELSNLYEVPFRLHAFNWHFIVSALIVVAITAGAFALRRRWPAVLVAWISYAAVVLPVSGIAHGGGQIVADRYSYLPCLAWALLAGGGLLAVARAVRDGHMSPGRARMIQTATALVIVALAILAARQTRVWHDSSTLWEHAFAIHPLEQLRRAVPARESDVRAYEARLLELGDLSAYWATSYNLGVTRRAQGRMADAADAYARGAAVNPRNADSRNGWAAALIDLHRYDEAAQQLDEAIRLDPRHAKAHFNMAIVLAAQGRTADAIAAYRRSIAFDPASAEAHYNLAVLLAAANALTDAEAEYRQAIALKPRYAEAYNNLGVALGRQGRYAEAVEAFRTSLSINPSNPSAEKNLAQVLAVMKGR